jgi:hypothetical protein
MNVPSLGISVQWVSLGAGGWQLTRVQSGGRASRGLPGLMVGDIIERVCNHLRVGSQQLPQNPGSLDAVCRTGPLSLEILRTVQRFTGPSIQRMWVNIR